MSNAIKIETITFVLLTGFWLSEDTFAKTPNIGEPKPKLGTYIGEPIVKGVANNIKSKAVQPNQSLKFGSNGAGKSGKYDTILVDSLDGKKVFFRKFREKIVDQFVDSTDNTVEGITENDSIFFRYSDTAGTKDFDVFKISSKTKNIYLLHFQYNPTSPPSGQALAIIAPVRGAINGASKNPDFVMGSFYT